MCRTLRPRSRTIARMLLLALAVVLSATCIATAHANPAEDACCASMAEDCGTSMAQVHTCCPTESLRLDQQSVAGNRVVVSAPAVTSATMLAVMPVPAGLIAMARHTARELRPPLRGGPVTHLRLANLRI